MDRAFALEPSEWLELRELLDQALLLPPRDRNAWLAGLGTQHRHRDRLAGLLCHTGAADVADTLPKLSTLMPAQPNVGGYRVIRALGSGGMATVWLAERDGRRVALKVPHASWRRDGLAERLERERKILAALTHPRIARLVDAGVADDGGPFLALEVVEGEPIDRYSAARNLGARERIALILQAAGVVAHAHAARIVHRDLKPAHLIVDLQGNVHLLDFGIAALLERGQAVQSDLTRAAGQPFTPDYAAPEQLRGERVGTAADIYALGVVLYELLTGVRPHRREGRPADDFAAEVCTTDPPPPSARATDPNVAAALRGNLDIIVTKALRRTPIDRYASVEHFAADLESHLAGRTIAATPVAGARGWATLVGRGEETAEVGRMLRSAQRLITLVGPGGVGKTALARAVCDAVAADGASPAWTDLAALEDLSQVPAAIAAAARVQPGAGDAIAQLAAALAGAPRLLVLDNAEHLLPALGAMVATLLDAVAPLRVLATSREPLHVRDEQVLRLTALPVPPADATPSRAREAAAYRLLEERVAAAEFGMRIDEHSAADAVSLCRALDGLPLAIEWAAARWPALGAKGVHELLEARAAAPHERTFDPPSAAQRQRTLRDTFDWSFARLDAGQQATLRRLAVFRGAFDADLAELVVAGDDIAPWRVREHVFALVDRSLLVSERDGVRRRLRLLDTTRRFAAEHLAAVGETALVEGRYVVAMTALAERLHEVWQATLDDDAIVARFAPHGPDLEHAFARACAASQASPAGTLLRALRTLDVLRGVIAGTEARLTGALRLLPAADWSARAALLGTVASCGWLQVEDWPPERASRESVAAARAGGADAKRLASLLILHATNSAVAGRASDARAALAEAEPAVRSSTSPRLRVIAAIHAAHVDLYCGAAAASVARLRELLPVLHAADAGAFHTYVATHATKAAVAAGDFDAALEIGGGALDGIKARGLRGYQSSLAAALLHAALQRGNRAAARVAVDALLDSASTDFSAGELYRLAWHGAHAGRVEPALRLCGVADGLAAARVALLERRDDITRDSEARSAVVALAAARLAPERVDALLRQGALLDDATAAALAREVVAAAPAGPEQLR